MSDPRLVFVLSPYQNAFFAEVAEALSDALRAVGHDVLTVTEPGDHEVGADDVFVLLPPHEYVALEGTDFIDDPTVAARTIGISAEQPHQHFFERNAAVGAELGAVLDFSALAVATYQALGVDARHLPFGYVPRWDRVEAEPVGRSREIDVLYLGNKHPRRLATLAEAADVLARHATRLVVSDNAEPNVGTSPTFLAGDAKRDLLGRTRLLVNIHQSDEPYFEWLRFADAAHCGVAVLSERSLHSEPFVAGTHFLDFERPEFGRRLGAALADGDRLDEIAAAAYAELRNHPLADGIDVLVEAAQRLCAEPPPPRLPARGRRAPIGRLRQSEFPVDGSWRPSLRRRATGLLRHAGGAHDTVVAPQGTTFRRPLHRPDGVEFATCVADGLDGAGRPTLEGIWPWEPWRLEHGQHLGRVMTVSRDLLDAVHDWVREPWAAEHPHLAVQLFAVVHGLDGAHVPTPIASIEGEPLDPEALLPDEVAARVRAILDDHRVPTTEATT